MDLLFCKIIFIFEIIFYILDKIHLPMNKIGYFCLVILWNIIHADAQKMVTISVVEEPTCVAGFALRFKTYQSDLLPTEYCLSMTDDFIFEQI